MTLPVAAYLGLGANLGDPAQAVREAVLKLSQLPRTRLARASSLYASAPVDAGGDDFVNAVIRLDTELTPHELLSAMQAIEQDFGRERPFRNAPRTLDLDLLLYGDQLIDDAQLQVPHPRMAGRAFVLLPLLEIAPDIEIPPLGRASSLVMAAALQQQAISKMPGSAIAIAGDGEIG